MCNIILVGNTLYNKNLFTMQLIKNYNSLTIYSIYENIENKESRYV